MASNAIQGPVEWKYCDLVMKGGVTSGVIYPSGVVKLSSEYRFKNIGGTSAGAIAAAVSAAAEYGRRSGVADSYKVLDTLPGDLAKNRQLLRLFSPDASTRKVFRIALGVLGSRTVGGKIVRVLLGVVLAWPLLWFAFFAAGLLLPAVAYALIRWGSILPVFGLIGRHWFVCGLCGVLLGLPLAFGVTLFVVGKGAIAAIAQNGFGMCSGMASASAREDSLTVWIHRQIQKAAGRVNGPPLTFGDLWNAPLYPGEQLKTERMINFEVVTTGLTEGRPFTIPFLEGALYFDPAEMRRLFPSDIVDGLIRDGERAERMRHPIQPGETPKGDERKVMSPEGRELTRLPNNDDLPILVATRMSLSFPGLLSAVPLYRVEYTIDRNQRDSAEATRVGTKVWYSDGGICSNFPLNFFDSPLPRWPTFGINLSQAGSERCEGDRKEAKNFVWLPEPVGAVKIRWNSIGDCYWGRAGAVAEIKDWDRIGRFATAIMNTMQNWRDNLQIGAPGFRDRVVSVSLCADEGGLNLAMPDELIANLSARGAAAADLLLTEFDFPQHIFTRFRISLCSLQDYLGRLNESYSQPLPQDATGWEYIRNQARPGHYRWDRANIGDQAAQAIQDLLALTDSWEQAVKEREGFCTGSPRPKTTLQGRPDF